MFYKKRKFNNNFNIKPNFFKVNNQASGFTLVETMIAMTIFTLVMVIGLGALIVSSNLAKKSQGLRIAVDNVDFALESMTRELRMGSYYLCGTKDVSLSSPTATGDCIEGNTGIAFIPQNSNSKIAYYLENRRLVRKIGLISSDIISPEVKIDYLRFYVKGSGNDSIQPSVLILLRGVVTIRGEETPFALQSMATQRSAEK